MAINVFIQTERLQDFKCCAIPFAGSFIISGHVPLQPKDKLRNRAEKLSVILQIIEEQDDYIQSLGIAQLHEVERNSEFLFQNEMSLQTDGNYEDLRYDNTGAYFQSLPLKELRKLETNSHPLRKVNEADLQHKAKLKGLERHIILIIKTKKEKTTLEQILTYCNKLHILYNQILPEIFTQTTC